MLINHLIKIDKNNFNTSSSDSSSLSHSVKHSFSADGKKRESSTLLKTRNPGWTLDLDADTLGIEDCFDRKFDQ